MVNGSKQLRCNIYGDIISYLEITTRLTEDLVDAAGQIPKDSHNKLQSRHYCDIKKIAIASKHILNYWSTASFSFLSNRVMISCMCVGWWMTGF